MTRYDDILARLRAATGPDCDLDIEIADLLFERVEPVVLKGDPTHSRIQMWRYPEGSIGTELRATSSVDAALALVEKMLPGWKWQGGSHSRPWAILYHPDWEETLASRHSSRCREGAAVPIDILIATFTTLAAQEAEHG